MNKYNFPNMFDTSKIPVDIINAFAEAWASIDGKLDNYLRGKEDKKFDNLDGSYSGYQIEAIELLKRALSKNSSIKITSNNSKNIEEIYSEEEGRIEVIKKVLPYLEESLQELKHAGRFAPKFSGKISSELEISIALLSFQLK